MAALPGCQAKPLGALREDPKQNTGSAGGEITRPRKCKQKEEGAKDKQAAVADQQTTDLAAENVTRETRVQPLKEKRKKSRPADHPSCLAVIPISLLVQSRRIVLSTIQ